MTTNGPEPAAGDEFARRSWSELRTDFASRVKSTFVRWITPEQPHFREQLQFALGRFDEGRTILQYFGAHGHIAEHNRILDIGAGNGGVSLAIANDVRTSVFAMDIVPNGELFELRRSLGVPIHQVVASGHNIPFSPDTFDIVILLDTLEHVPAPRALAQEIMRVLRPGGVCMITTPARLRHAFARDPHYQVPGLVLLPNAVQRFIVNHVFRRRIGYTAGHIAGAYDVEHIFWHVDEIAALFPEPKQTDVLYNTVYTPPPGWSWLCLRHPRIGWEWLRWRVRHFFWDRVLIRKGLADRTSAPGVALH